jgi:ERCC4-type nuclease
VRAKPLTSKSTSYKLKPIIFPNNFILLQDTREQRPLFARLPRGLVICSTTLKDGDYSIRGFENSFAIERKRLSDLLSYCTTEREKTVKKMERFRKMEWVGLVIEVAERDLLRPYLNSKVSPEVVRQALASFEIRYRVHIYYNPDPEQIGRWVLDRAVKYYKMKREV